MANRDAMPARGPVCERWAPVPGWAGMYEVSSLGRVRGVSRMDSSGNHSVPPKILRTRLDRGYPSVRLNDKSRHGRARQIRVHRLVALAFLGTPEDGQEVNHKDGDKTNPSVSNLEWVSRSDNLRHAHAHGLMNVPTGERHPHAKLTAVAVRVIRRADRLGVPHPYIGLAFGISKQAVRSVCTGRTWAHVPALAAARTRGGER